MSESRLEKFERFIANPWFVASLGIAVGAFSMIYPQKGVLLLQIAAVLLLVAVVRQCQSLKMPLVQIIAWAVFAASIVLVFFSYSIWAPKNRITDAAGLKLTITGAALDVLPEHNAGIQLIVNVLNQGAPTSTHGWNLVVVTSKETMPTFFAAGAPRSISSPDLPRLNERLQSRLETNNEAIGLVTFSVKRDLAWVLALGEDPSAKFELTTLDENNKEWETTKSIVELMLEFRHEAASSEPTPTPPPDLIEGTKYTERDMERIFPFGFVVFTQQGKGWAHLVSPNGHVSWTADWWNNVQIVPDFVNREISWTVNDFSASKNDNGKEIILYSECDMTRLHLPMKVGGIYPMNCVAPPLNEPEVFLGTLSDDQRSPVFVLGFRINTERTK